MKHSSPGPISSPRTFLRTRLPALGGIALVAVLLAAGTYSRGTLQGGWEMLHVPAMSATFADLRGVTQSIDCVLNGEDPYRLTTCDPFNRPYNYPPIWLGLRYLGVTSRSTNLLGLLIGCMTITALILLFSAQRIISAAVVFFSVISAPVLLGIERGNTDLVVFSLMVFGFLLIDHWRAKRMQRNDRTTHLNAPGSSIANSHPADANSLATAALIILLTVLKIYPLALLAVLIRRRRRLTAAVLTAAAALGALFLTSRHRFGFIFANTPLDRDISFGALPFFLVMAQHTHRALVPSLLAHHSIARQGALLIACGSVAAGWVFRSMLPNVLPHLDFTGAKGRLAVSGLAIFCVAFLRGSSYDYRLIFLLGVLAYLVDDLNTTRSLRSVPACIALVLLLWSPFQTRLLVNEALDGLIFVGACAWLGTSLIANLRSTETGSAYS